MKTNPVHAHLAVLVTLAVLLGAAALSAGAMPQPLSSAPVPANLPTDLSAAAQATISAAIGRDQTAYHLRHVRPFTRITRLAKATKARWLDGLGAGQVCDGVGRARRHAPSGDAPAPLCAIILTQTAAADATRPQGTACAPPPPRTPVYAYRTFGQACQGRTGWRTGLLKKPQGQGQ